MGMDDFGFMDEALVLARQAAAEGEVPVGCVIVRQGQIVGRGRNRRETGRTALGHAEIQAIAQACETLGGWRLWDCTLYVTLEPCPMCAGAIVNARIPRVVFGASDAKSGACGSVCDLFSMNFNHHPIVEKGIREAEASALLTTFFQDLRLTLRSRPKWKKPSVPGGNP
jgi:tRNA(adenine34) deaminase